MEDNKNQEKEQEENTIDNKSKKDIPIWLFLLIFFAVVGISAYAIQKYSDAKLENTDIAKYIKENKEEWDELRDRIHNAATELEENKKNLEKIKNGEYIERETEFTYEHYLIMLKDIKKEIKAAKQAAEKGEAEKLHKIYILTQAYIDGYESGLFYPESIDDIVTIHKMLGEAKEEFEKSKDISKINDVILFIDDIVDK